MPSIVQDGYLKEFVTERQKDDNFWKMTLRQFTTSAILINMLNNDLQVTQNELPLDSNHK